ncbi:BMP family protein [Nocardioides sp.]|uniref:BMP family lipoprotein n=1 Tax=Nocardioides sp. TaxID=35761 RepID=UPI0027326708|nr:BMP family ABC transporter substrate-binding protein [Nocardioides sp.]MDP3894841.1 BMP family ABC transporter substrate-binding protein [Nocardioides sp.]
MRNFAKISIAGLVASLVLAGCGSDDPDTGTDDANGNGNGGEQTSEVKVGLAYDVGGRGDQSFNDAAAAGLDQAIEEYGIDSQESTAADGEPESAREERQIQMAVAGFNPVNGVGFAYAPAVAKVAPQFPETQFGLIDSTDATGDNIANLVFPEHEGSFLVGAAAALKSETGNIGFVGGVNVPLIGKFEAGYRAGAEAVNPDIEIQSTYLTQPPDFSGFGDPAKGRTAAEGMFDGGADIVYHAAGGSGLGVFEAAQAAGGLGIGVDSDQYNTVPEELQDVVMTSMLKKVDVAVFDYIKSFVDGEPLSGEVVFGLEEGGVDYSTTGGAVDDISGELDDYKQQIIDGEIEVPSSM